MADELLIEKYPSPKPFNALYTQYWNMFINDIGDRGNLKQSHITTQLKILCSLCVEYDELEEFIELNGRTYESMGRNGLQYKRRPELDLMKGCISEIRQYSKMLDLVLVKDTKMSNEREEKNDFS